MEIPGNGDRFLPVFVNSVIQQLEDVKMLKKRLEESQNIIANCKDGFKCPDCGQMKQINDLKVQCGYEEDTTNKLGGCGKWICWKCWVSFDEQNGYVAFCADCSQKSGGTGSTEDS